MHLHAKANKMWAKMFGLYVSRPPCEQNIVFIFCEWLYKYQHKRWMDTKILPVSPKYDRIKIDILQTKTKSIKKNILLMAVKDHEIVF